MSSNLSNAQRSQEVRTLDTIRPEMAKAVLSSDRVGLPFRQVQGDAVVRFYGSVKAAAFALGQVDPSLMQREFREGKFGRFDEHANEQAKAFVANALAETFGTLLTREARIQQLRRSIAESLDEMAQLAVSA